MLTVVISRLRRKCSVSMEGCWLWSGDLDSEGRPLIAISTGGKRHIQRLIAAYTYKRPYEDTDQLALICFNPICCNPEHIILAEAPERDVVREVEEIKPKPKRFEVGLSWSDEVKIKRLRHLGMSCLMIGAATRLPYKAIQAIIEQEPAV